MTKLLLLVFAAVVHAQIYAIATLRGTSADPGVTGTVTFTQPVAGGSVTVSVSLSGIAVNPNALHGIHVHQFGDLSDEVAAASAGGHWVGPLGNGHGCPEVNSTSRHWGDTGNWQATGGSIVGTKTLDLLALTGVNSIVGRGVVLHATVDDCAVVASAGQRLAFGVIGIVNSTVYGGQGEATQDIAGTTGAICILKPTQGSTVAGKVYFIQPGGVGATTVYAEVTGITGPHGVHLHWWGDISGPTGLATGGHYNPFGLVHGVPPYLIRHKGDLGIISYYENGVAYYKYPNDMISLNGLYNVMGRAIHIHANSDDCSNPVGNGGARLAQCVVGFLFNQTLPAFPAALPEGQNGYQICNANGVTTGLEPPIYPSSATALGASIALSLLPLYF